MALPAQVDSVEEMKRRDAYERSQQLRRIQEETERSRQLLAQRKDLQDQRRTANMQASFQRQQIVEVRKSARGCSLVGCIHDTAARLGLAAAAIGECCLQGSLLGSMLIAQAGADGTPVLLPCPCPAGHAKAAGKQEAPGPRRRGRGGRPPKEVSCTGHSAGRQGHPVGTEPALMVLA